MAQGRRQLSKRVRFEVLRRDGFRCKYCGLAPPDCVLVVDHVVPVARGGTNERTNLAAACHDCNAGKHASELVTDINDAIACAKSDPLADFALDAWGRLENLSPWIEQPDGDPIQMPDWFHNFLEQICLGAAEALRFRWPNLDLGPDYVMEDLAS